MNILLQQNIDNIEKVCRTRNVLKLYSFGSIYTQLFNEESDIDLLVEFKDLFNENYADNYLDMCYDLEDILKRKVDLVTTNSVSNPIFKQQLESSKRVIYQA